MSLYQPLSQATLSVLRELERGPELCEDCGHPLHHHDLDWLDHDEDQPCWDCGDES